MRFLSVVPAITLAMAAALSSLAEAETAEICAEAAQRYAEIFGKAPKDEPVAIVTMYKHTFCPPQLTVRQGTRIRFVNVDKRTSHSFWFRDAARPESDRFFSGEGSEIVADFPPGEHTYLCGPHWEREGMIGRLVVTP
jgi:plastocyanin